jgi:hypothetical protein
MGHGVEVALMVPWEEIGATSAMTQRGNSLTTEEGRAVERGRAAFRLFPYRSGSVSCVVPDPVRVVGILLFGRIRVAVRSRSVPTGRYNAALKRQSEILKYLQEHIVTGVCAKLREIMSTSPSSRWRPSRST